ncbi:MAG: methylated-DNA--[protein]-cysteine S-methyltransferase [Actinomycetota bacterium]
MSLTLHPYDSPVGELRLVATDDALVAVLWPDDAEGRVRFSEEPVEGSHEVLHRTASQLDEYFAGERQSFDLPLEPNGTEFQRSVWWSLAEIPFGETSTYGAQAEVIGRPRAVRAVGTANGKNPLSIVLPCHRIVGADGGLAGFAGGLETKRWLLDHEASVAAQ